MNILVKAVAALSLLACSSWASHAGPLKVPTAEPILEIVGAIQSTNAPGAATFDREMLEGLGLETITTATPWHQGQVRFEGVPLKKLLASIGAQGKTVKAVALNDYVTTIPVDDFAKHGTILALKRDGQYMPVRDKGPLFIIYPYDSDPHLKSQMYYARSAWQVKRLEVQP
jgi:hypothetical protein